MSIDPLRITTTDELLKAVELGIVDKTEARTLLGLPVKRGRLAKLQPREGGRFTRGDLVYPFDRFSADAREAMTRAQDLAGAAGRTNIETADMLLAIAGHRESEGAQALHSLGIDEAKLRPALDAAAHTETPMASAGPTLQLKHVVEAAFHGVGYPSDVGTRHLLLALAAGEGAASTVLAELGASEPALRAALDPISTGEAE
jgi:hypothetical protein